MKRTNTSRHATAPTASMPQFRAVQFPLSTR